MRSRPTRLSAVSGAAVESAVVPRVAKPKCRIAGVLFMQRSLNGDRFTSGYTVHDFSHVSPALMVNRRCRCRGFPESRHGTPPRPARPFALTLRPRKIASFPLLPRRFTVLTTSALYVPPRSGTGQEYGWPCLRQRKLRSMRASASKTSRSPERGRPWMASASPSMTILQRSSATGAPSRRSPTARCSRATTGFRSGSTTSGGATACSRSSSPATTDRDKCCFCCRSASSAAVWRAG